MSEYVFGKHVERGMTMMVLQDNILQVSQACNVEKEGSLYSACAGEKKISFLRQGLQVWIDGVLVKLPTPFRVLNGIGWDFSLSEYDCDSYVLSCGCDTECIVLTNPEYYRICKGANYPHIGVYMRNRGNVTADVKDCDVFALDITRIVEGRIVSKHPNIALSGGITWDSTMRDMISVYGRPNTCRTFYMNGVEYTVCSYVGDYGSMELTVCSAGLCGIRLEACNFEALNKTFI